MFRLTDLRETALVQAARLHPAGYAGAPRSPDTDLPPQLAKPSPTRHWQANMTDAVTGRLQRRNGPPSMQLTRVALLR